MKQSGSDDNGFEFAVEHAGDIADTDFKCVRQMQLDSRMSVMDNVLFCSVL